MVHPGVDHVRLEVPEHSDKAENTRRIRQAGAQAQGIHRDAKVGHALPDGKQEHECHHDQGDHHHHRRKPVGNERDRERPEPASGSHHRDLFSGPRLDEQRDAGSRGNSEREEADGSLYDEIPHYEHQRSRDERHENRCRHDDRHDTSSRSRTSPPLPCDSSRLRIRLSSTSSST